MKKVLTLILALCLVLSLAACGGDDSKKEDDDDKDEGSSATQYGESEGTSAPTDDTGPSQGTEDSTTPSQGIDGPSVTIDPVVHHNGTRDELQLVPFHCEGMTVYLDDSFELDGEFSDSAEFTNRALDVYWQRIPTSGLQSGITNAKQIMRYWKDNHERNWGDMWEGEANGVYYLVGRKEETSKGFAIGYYMGTEYYYRISVQTRDLDKYLGEMITYITSAQITEAGVDETFMPQQKINVDGLTLYMDATFGINDEYEYDHTVTAFRTDGTEIVTEVTMGVQAIDELAVTIENTDDLVAMFTNGDDDVAEVGKRNGVDYVVYNDGDGFIMVYGLYLMDDHYWTVSFWSVFGYEEHLDQIIDHVTSAQFELVVPVSHELEAGFRFWLDSSIAIEGEITEDWISFRSDEVRGDAYRDTLSIYGLQGATSKEVAEHFAESYSYTESEVVIEQRNGVYYIVSRHPEYGFGDVIGFYVQGEYYWSISVSSDDMDDYCEKMIQYATSGEIL